MNFYRSIAVALLAVPMSALPAFSQSPTPQPTPLLRGYVAAFAGAVTGPPAEGSFAAEYGENMGQRAQAYVNLSYFDNIMPSATRDQLTALGPAVTARTAALTPGSTTPYQFSGRDRGVSFTGGGKFLIPVGAAHPYVGGGAGVIDVTRTITERHLGDVTQAVFNDYNIGDPELLDPKGATKPVVEIVAGIGFVFKHTYVDAGYRYRRVYGLDDYKFSQFTGGIGYKW
jgi:hypothetical protein